MSTEEKKENTTPKTEEAKTEAPTIDADVKEQPDGTQKAEEHVGVGTKIWNGFCAVGRGIKKAAPVALGVVIGASGALGVTYFVGGKADKEDRIAGETQAQIPEKDEGEQQ